MIPAGQGPGPGLAQALRERLEAGPLGAAEFMELALYHPGEGYYRRAVHGWGLEGADYYTALDCGPLLGEALACRLRAAWEEMGCPGAFTVLECGAGRGWLGRDLLASASGPFAAALRYLHLDPHPAAREAAREALAPWLAEGRARILEDGERPAPFQGALLSNELLDALPAQPWRWDGQRWEREVLTREGAAWEAADPGDAGPWFASQAEGGLRPGDGAAFCPGLEDLVMEMTGLLERGLEVCIDYGDSTARLLAKGSGLRRYRGHRVDGRWWEDPGACDLTADVDFTRLEHLLGRAGLTRVLRQPLGGWVRSHAPLAHWEQAWNSLPAEERRRRTGNLLQLTLPSFLGGRFSVVEGWRG